MLFWSKKHCSLKIQGCRSILGLLVMGATCSKANDEAVANNFKILASQTPFTQTEVESLYELYRKLSSSITKNGYIDKEEFQLAVFRNSKQKNLFLDRMFVLFDVDGNGHIEFGEFVCSLGVFHPKAPREAKIKYLFELYDLRRTGFIEHEEVKEMVLALLQESDLVLDGDAVGMIVDKTFTEADTKCDGRIDEEEWKEYVDKNPSMLKNMTLPHLIDINQAFPSFVLNTEAKDL